MMNGGGGVETLIGKSGTDVLIGRKCNDVLAVSNLTFKRIVGSTGIDTLRLDGGGLLLKLTTLSDRSVCLPQNVLLNRKSSLLLPRAWTQQRVNLPVCPLHRFP